MYRSTKLIVVTRLLLRISTKQGLISSTAHYSTLGHGYHRCMFQTNVGRNTTPNNGLLPTHENMSSKNEPQLYLAT